MVVGQKHDTSFIVHPFRRRENLQYCNTICNTVSKIVEILVLARLMPHFLASGNFNPLQSAYRTGHSTETALLRILDSLYKSIDTTCLTSLIGLDLLGAFDTISHSILLGRIKDEFGVSGVPLRWLQSYLTDRRRYVKLGRHCSPTVQCTAGVPQSSVLGPILFAAYISPVGQLITSHAVDHHQYADDTQLFLAMPASTIHASLSTLEACTRESRCQTPVCREQPSAQCRQVRGHDDRHSGSTSRCVNSQHSRRR